MKKFKKILILLIFVTIPNFAFSMIIKKIEISGNERISDETIIVFASVNVNDDLNEEGLNEVLKRLYETNFFETIEISFKDDILIVNVKEAPIIENIQYNGIKSNSLKTNLLNGLKIRNRSSYNETLVQEDRDKILKDLSSQGYLFATVDILKNSLPNNKIDLIFNITLNEKAKIKKITFLGNKYFKDRELRNIIVSEEYKFWKFISGRKFLNPSSVEFDERLLKNFYLNKGFYNVEIKSSFAKIYNNSDFELIFNINSNDKFYFGDLKLDLPIDFDRENFKNLEKILYDKKNEVYSLFQINEILDELDNISIEEQFVSLKASVEESIIDNLINLTFKFEETPKFYIQKINIFGNNVTNENVIRNQFLIDEGDPFNEILYSRSINNVKSLNFFRNVNSSILSGDDDLSKVINVNIEEKATGQITAGAGFGTSGGTVAFGIKENNYLGKGITLDTNVTINQESIEGNFYVLNPNYNNSNKSIFFNLQSSETDRLSDSGYKSNRSGFSLGTTYEYLRDTYLTLSNSHYFEKITTDSKASVLQRKQQGNYWDSFLNIGFDYDKRDQKFKPSDGFRSIYSTNIPLVSDTNTFSNSYDYKYYTQLFEDNISSFSFSVNSANSLSDQVKLSERLYIPSNKLRGFERGKVGPKDGADFIGGNYMASVNFSSTMPNFLTNFQNVDIILFTDIANLWGVDYNSQLDGSQKFRSSVGIGVDWFSAIGPLNFSLAQPLTKEDNDITETFRFNIGTSF